MGKSLPVDRKFPLDRGWAWVICLGGFITHTVLGSGGQVTSVLFVELVEKFGTTITTASFILMCHVVAFSLSTVIFPAIVLPKLRERWTVILGGFLLFVASIGCAYSPHIGVFIAFSILKGTASGCVFVPCSSLIRIYFKRRQSTASVIAYCGGSVAAIVAPFCIRAMRREYGISGTYLIQAALELNVCVAGMLMRPVSFYGYAPEEIIAESEEKRKSGLLSTDIKAEYPSADKVFFEKGEFNVLTHQFNRQLSITHRSDQLPTIDENKLLSRKLLNSCQKRVVKGGSITSLPAKAVTDGNISSLQTKAMMNSASGLPTKSLTQESINKLLNKSPTQESTSCLPTNKPPTQESVSSLPLSLSTQESSSSLPSSPLTQENTSSLETKVISKENINNLSVNLQDENSTTSIPTIEPSLPSSLSTTTINGDSSQCSIANNKLKEQTEFNLTTSSEHGKLANTCNVSEKPVFVSCTNTEELLESQAYQILIEQEKHLLNRELSVDDRPKAPYGSVFTLASEAGRAIEILMIEEISSLDEKKGLKRWRHIYHKSSLGLWAFRMTLIAALPGTVNQYLVGYLPTIANSLGASLDQAANLVTIMGAIDLFSRLGMGLIADSKILPPSRILAVAQISMGIVCQFSRLFTSFPLLILMVLLMGLFVGSRVSLLPLVCTEIVGSERMPQAYSISAMSTALIGATWSPVFGSIAQSTKSFEIVLHLIGAGFLLSGLLMFTLTWFSRLDKKQKKDVLMKDTK